jgi:hypothetical protein
MAAIMAVMVLSVAACVKAPPEIPYERASALKTIGIISPSIPHDATVFLASSPGQSFGLIGALIDAGVQSHRESKFSSILSQHDFSAQDSFLKALNTNLAAHGYTVTSVTGTREKPGEFFKAYPAAEPKVDAYLDILMSTYGYYAAGVGGSTPYRPYVALQVRLVRASDQSVLMQDSITYSAAAQGQGVITISPDPAYTYPSSDQLESDADNSVKGLQIALAKSAEAVSSLMK